MSIKLTVCGARGSFPAYGKEFEIFGQDTSCYVIRDGSYALILDCGSGLAGAGSCLAGCEKIDVILSHIHYDHICGLFQPPEEFSSAKLDFYGNFDAWINTEKEKKDENPLFCIEELAKGELHPVSMNVTYELGGGFFVGFSPSNHGDDTAMIDIKKDGKRICFTGDYEHNETSGIGLWAADCDLLLFDGSYTPEMYHLFRGWGHSKWEDGCVIARENRIKQLVITHHAPQYSDSVLQYQERRALEIFDRTVFARQGSVFRV